MLTSSSGNVPVLKELCCLVPVYFFDPDIRPPARRAKAHLHGLGFAFAPGVRGAITKGPRSLPTKNHTKKHHMLLKRPHGTLAENQKTAV